MRRTAAFTLVEIMVVVGVIALLAVLAVPSLLHARQETQNAKFVNALRIATDAFEIYAAEHNNYPPDALRAIVPTGMANYFGNKLDWTAPTPIGGSWDWDYNQFGFTAGVSVVNPTISTQQLLEIDRKIDDGNLSTGSFQDKGSGRYTSILQ